MSAFLDAYEFWRNDVAGIVLAGLLCGYLGVYVVLRRVVFVGAALTQLSGFGVAAAFFVASYFPVHDAHAGSPWWVSPQLYSVTAALAGALLFSLVRGGGRLASETVVGIGWVVASASLLLILSSRRITQEKHEVDDLLYGAGVLLSWPQVKALAAVVAGVLAVHLAFYRPFIFVSYDAEMARTVGYRARFWEMLLYATFGVGISFVVKTIGALPAFGFLVIPAAAAQLLVRRVRWAFPLAMTFAVAAGFLGYYLSFTRRYPTGAAIVATSALFLLPGLLRRALGRPA